MRFIKEDLETELQDKQRNIDDITNNIIELFNEVNFESELSINGISFSNIHNNIYASFYIDDNLNYKGYITNTEDASFNYSVKGNIDTVEEAAEKLIDTYEINL